MENISIELSIIISLGISYIGMYIWDFINPTIEDEFDKEHEDAVRFREETP